MYRAGPIQLDEARVELRVAGERRALEAKPMALLHALLLRGGAAVGKHELIEAVWGNADHTSAASLATAISKIRAALGAPGRGLIDVVHGSGYRIAAPVEIIIEEPVFSQPIRGLQDGTPVPLRPSWELERRLGDVASCRVWLARCALTNERRVLRFAESVEEHLALRRRVETARNLHAALGPRADILQVFGSQFEKTPHFIEIEYGGLDFASWSGGIAGLDTLELVDRVTMVAGLARTLSACHAAGILHGDLKPASLFLGLRSGWPPVLSIGDFGSDRAAGPTYVAPELRAGGPPTISTDIYALGVLLYQIVIGDPTRVLGVGWENDVADPLLCEDIGEAAAADPGRRLTSAIALAERLTSIPARREAKQRRARAQEQAAIVARLAERQRLRRPWKIAAVASLLMGLAVSTISAVHALHDRDEAAHRAHLAQAVNNFLTQDLFGRGNPAQSGKPDETLMQAAEAAEAGIDRRLSNDPLVAGAIYLSLARAYDSRSAFDAGRRAYGGAIAQFDRAGKTGAAPALIARLQLAIMEVTSLQPGAAERARVLVATVLPMIGSLGARRQEAATWLADARATLEMTGGNVLKAQAFFKEAADRAEAMPEVFDAGTSLTMRQHQGLTYGRLGEWDNAESMLSDVVRKDMALDGPRHPDTLGAELDLAEVRAARGDTGAALRDLDRITPLLVSVLGPAHRETLDALATRADALEYMGRYDDAVSDQLSIQRAAVTLHGARSWPALTALINIAELRCRSGNLEEGLVSAKLAHDDANVTFGGASIMTQVAGSELAFCLVLSGQTEGVLKLLDAVDRQAVSQAFMAPKYGSQMDVLRAAVLRRTGHEKAAAALLCNAALELTLPDAEPFMRKWVQHLVADTPAPCFLPNKGSAGPR